MRSPNYMKCFCELQVSLLCLFMAWKYSVAFYETFLLNIWIIQIIYSARYLVDFEVEHAISKLIVFWCTFVMSLNNEVILYFWILNYHWKDKTGSRYSYTYRLYIEVIILTSHDNVWLVSHVNTRFTTITGSIGFQSWGHL